MQITYCLAVTHTNIRIPQVHQLAVPRCDSRQEIVPLMFLHVLRLYSYFQKKKKTRKNQKTKNKQKKENNLSANTYIRLGVWFRHLSHKSQPLAHQSVLRKVMKALCGTLHKSHSKGLRDHVGGVAWWQFDNLTSFSIVSSLMGAILNGQHIEGVGAGSQYQGSFS